MSLQLCVSAEMGRPQSPCRLGKAAREGGSGHSPISFPFSSPLFFFFFSIFRFLFFLNLNSRSCWNIPMNLLLSSVLLSPLSFLSFSRRSTPMSAENTVERKRLGPSVVRSSLVGSGRRMICVLPLRRSGRAPNAMPSPLSPAHFDGVPLRFGAPRRPRGRRCHSRWLTVLGPLGRSFWCRGKRRWQHDQGCIFERILHSGLEGAEEGEGGNTTPAESMDPKDDSSNASYTPLLFLTQARLRFPTRVPLRLSPPIWHGPRGYDERRPTCRRHCSCSTQAGFCFFCRWFGRHCCPIW